ncbi:restriction endonuclease [Rhizobium tubonense]|uniref:Restriction endonuclease type IV Mrr domain-containing protein n=1 Tax=Rhizobium tubonense TaxID=484088 RepID=A0A2W4CS90_9HYPH|nr:restriction endonuclease [Rhizobium tubonense]PZM13718.1 hypothetical protein CPY51_12595 [Rhizobium tubonense]
METDLDFVGAIAEALVRSDASDSNHERGRILEEIVRYVFGALPGFTHWRNRVITNKGDAEFDVCFQNDVRQNPFNFASAAIVIECKNTGRPVGSGDVRKFISKMDDHQLDWAFLVAANGITGAGKKTSHAHSVIQTARLRRRNLLVITRKELQSLRSASEFVALVRDKIMLHSLNSPMFA